MFVEQAPAVTAAAAAIASISPPGPRIMRAS
jgi:hypothetical protein